MTSLLSYVDGIRPSFSAIENEAKQLTKCDEYEEEYKRPRKRNRRFEDFESQPVVAQSPSDRFKNETFFTILDALSSELAKRQKAYEKLSNTFGFLRNLANMTKSDILNHSSTLVSTYPEDLDGVISEEFVHFAALLKTNLAAAIDEKKGKEVQYYALIKENRLEATFPNVEVALRIYLSMMVTNCSGERSFSKLKRIKNEQRTSIGQERLNHLALLSIEHEILRDINVQEIIDNFASVKSRKRHI